VLFYGDHKGKPGLRKIITEETGLDSEDVLVTPGAATALFIVATSLLEKGDHMVVAKSNYATNIETPRAIGANISYLNLEFEKAYKLDVEQLENLITPATKLVSLTYPHNPTGALIDLSTLKKIIEIIERKNTLLLFDETYREMSFASQLPVAAGLSERVISVSSMSKSYGLPGIRTGWLLCKNPGLWKHSSPPKNRSSLPIQLWMKRSLTGIYAIRKNCLRPLKLLSCVISRSLRNSCSNRINWNGLNRKAVAFVSRESKKHPR
jgi:aspartate/methionine/tyrosine aminotransferase